MLIRFSFKNFKSFKNESCLDMEATSLKEHDYNIVKTGKGDFLKIAAIYGANASGKTNVLQALSYMRKKVLKSDEIYIDRDERNNICSFMTNNRPIKFEVEILVNNKIYKYGFELFFNGVISEWLEVKKRKKFNTIFVRSGYLIDIKDKSIKDMVEPRLNSGSLFLNEYIEIDRDNEDFNNVYNWFVEAYYLSLGDPYFENDFNHGIYIKLINDKEYKKELLKFIRIFNPTIDTINIIPLPARELSNAEGTLKVEVVHNCEGGKSTLPLSFESSGTIKMLQLFNYFMDALKNGTTLLIDELDAKMHPILTKYIINLFHNPEINIGNGQLIYTTHDTVNLNKETFRRDEIWFTEKDKNGVSEIYSLSDYVIEDENGNTKKIRNDASYNKDYLTGRYGAIPLLDDFDIV